MSKFSTSVSIRNALQHADQLADEDLADDIRHVVEVALVFMRDLEPKERTAADEALLSDVRRKLQR